MYLVYAMRFTQFKVKKNIVLYVMKCINFYKAHHSEKHSELWLARYPVRCDWPHTSSVFRKLPRYHIWKHTVSPMTWQQQYYSENKSYSLFLCVKSVLPIFQHSDVDMWGRVWITCIRKVWTSLNFYKEYLFGFETLVFVTFRILYMHLKLEIASYNTFNITHHLQNQ